MNRSQNDAEISSGNSHQDVSVFLLDALNALHQEGRKDKRKKGSRPLHIISFIQIKEASKTMGREIKVQT